MPTKTWDTQTEWEEWTLTNLQVSNGVVTLAAGAAQGTALSPAYECASWKQYARVVVYGSLPAGTNIYLRFRTGNTQEECEAATWSSYINGFDLDGVMVYNLQVHILNEGISAGPWIQFELTLVSE